MKVADNILCQINGRKRIRCWNPSAHKVLHVFPDTHPRARKAQAPIDLDELLRSGFVEGKLSIYVKPSYCDKVKHILYR